MGRKHGTDMHQQSFVAQMTALGYLLAPPHVLVVAGHADPQHPALHTDRPHSLVALTKAYLILPLGKVRRRFSRMSRSMAYPRQLGPQTADLHLLGSHLRLAGCPCRLPARCALIQLPSVCSTTPNVRATDAALWPTQPADRLRLIQACNDLASTSSSSLPLRITTAR